jgi:hypothetical protein
MIAVVAVAIVKPWGGSVPTSAPSGRPTLVALAQAAPGAGVAPSSGVASALPAQGEAPAASESTGPVVVGSAPGTVGLAVGDHGAGFAGVICQELGNGQLSVSSGDPNDGEFVALVFRSDGTVSSLSGALRGVFWKVTQDPQGTLNADTSGTFSGKDAIGGADVSGTFAC